MYAARRRISSAASQDGAWPAAPPKPPATASNSAGANAPRIAEAMSRQSCSESVDFLCLCARRAATVSAAGTGRAAGQSRPASEQERPGTCLAAYSFCTAPQSIACAGWPMPSMPAAFT
jgi:hypothetical protein